MLRWTVTGALVGGVLGSVMLTSWANWPVPHRQAYLLVALGAISGCVLGRSLGTTRALVLRLQAELAQHQLEFERSTLARVAAPAGEAKRPAAPAPLPYVPVGVPPVSATTPAEDAGAYGRDALEPSAT